MFSILIEIASEVNVMSDPSAIPCEEELCG